MIPRLLKRYPLVFNGITGGLLCGSSDWMAQHVEHFKASQSETSDDQDSSGRSCIACSAISHSGLKLLSLEKLDLARLGSAGMIGIFFGGCVYPMAYAKLDAIWVGTSFGTVLQKSLVEIGTVGIFVNSISMSCRGWLRGDKSAPEVFDHVVDELPHVTRNDFFVWLPYNMLAFSFIPAVVRPTTTAMMEAMWQTYISLRSHDYGTSSGGDVKEETTLDC